MSSLEAELGEPRAQAVEVRADAIVVDLVDGRVISVPIVWFPRLWYGTEKERQNFTLIGEGAYIHWPDLDEDLTVAGLLAGRRSAERPESLRRWLDARARL